MDETTKIVDENRALAIVSALANGVNPLTGEIFPADSPYQAADVVRALFHASRALETRARPRSRLNAPPNAGKPWTQEEDRNLLKEFDAGRRLSELAQALGRTTAGIQARLEKYGRVQAQDAGASANRRTWRGENQRVET